MTTSEEIANKATGDKPGVERRRLRLPQPDFSAYKNANAYPGQGYFFVGHSFNLEESSSDAPHKKERTEAIEKFFGGESLLVPVHTALENPTFSGILSRVEHDMLVHLPETALVGPAFNTHGELIADSFTVWRKEKRKTSEFPSLKGR